MMSESTPTGGKTNVDGKVRCGVTKNLSGDDVESVPNGEDGTIYIRQSETFTHDLPYATRRSPCFQNPWLSTSGEAKSHEELGRTKRQERRSIWEIR